MATATAAPSLGNIVRLYTTEEVKKSTIIVVLGHPGAGKGTFAQSLKDKKLVHISLGDFLRSEFQHKTDIGLRWKKEVETQGILAIGVVKEVTQNLIQQISTSPPQVYILDGHVRMLEQAKHLDALLASSKNIHAVFIYINTEKDAALQRIINRRTCEKCHYIYNLVTSPPKIESNCDHCDGRLAHRDTDNPIHGLNRITTYEPHLIETVEYYRNLGRLVEFNGNLSLQECTLQYQEYFAECLE